MKIATRVHSTKKRPEVSSRGVVVEYMDRARRATLDIFAQHLPLTLHNAAKLGHFSMGSNGRWRTSEHTRTSNGSIRARSLPYELHCDRYQPTQAKNRAEPALSACVRRRRILSSRAAAAETRQREKVATPSRTADPRACRRVSGYIGACHKQRLHEFDLETTLADLRRSLQDAARPM